MQTKMTKNLKKYFRDRLGNIECIGKKGIFKHDCQAGKKSERQFFSIRQGANMS